VSLLNEPHTILAGDFNSNPGSAPVGILKKRFADCFEESDFSGKITTFHDFGLALQGPQIDYIFYDRAFSLERFEVLTEDGPEYCSDHFPLGAEFRLRRLT
jgi:endonuclease/exonuclease/phosphatase family metal-dependent hydrolase